MCKLLSPPENTAVGLTAGGASLPLIAGGQGRSGSGVWWSAVVVCVCGLSLLALAAWSLVR